MPEDLFPSARLVAGYGEGVDRGEQMVSFLYLLELEFLVWVDNPLEKTSIVFLWPFQVRIQSPFIIASFAIMEQNVSAYFGDERPVLRAEKLIDEKDVLETIFQRLPPGASPVPLDINKGIKALWQNGIIDAPRVGWKKPRATATQTMDQSFLVKRDDPGLYAQLRRQPLFKTVFKAMDPAAFGFSGFFVVEPGKGFLSFPSFARGPDDRANVIREILHHNR